MPIEGEIAAGLALHEATDTGIHGVGAGKVVGTTLAQTLTNKTLTSPVINGTITTTGLTMPAFTLGGNVTINGKVFDAGAGLVEIDSTGNVLLTLQSTQDGAAGVTINLSHVSASPAAADILGRILAGGKNSAGASKIYGRLYFNLTDPTATTEAGDFSLTLMSAGAENLALTLSGAGTLAVDLSGVSGVYANVDLFDEYDDALVLRQGLQQNNRELLASMGVLTRKNTGSGYMMNLQPMVRLLAGGIYQTRQMLEDTRGELLARLADVEARLARAGLN